MLASVAAQPHRDDLERELQMRTYVRQLALIELDDDEKIAAVTDFLKAEVDRVEWARQGRVLEDAYDGFEIELHAAWRNHQRRCEVAHAARTEVDRGKLLYSDCFEHQVRLEQAIVPPHFCRGSFHKLADDIKIGWHPKFADLLNPVRSSGGDNTQ
jgi:hypothetical protein